MRIALSADHAGYELKQQLARACPGRPRGARSRDPFNRTGRLPDAAESVALALRRTGRARRDRVRQWRRGLDCGQQVPGIRAAVCHDTYTAHQAVEHDDLNVLCLGARVIGSALAQEIVDAFLSARFSGNRAHQRRLDKILEIEGRFIRS